MTIAHPPRLPPLPPHLSKAQVTSPHCEGVPFRRSVDLGSPSLWVERHGLPVGAGLLDSGDQMESIKWVQAQSDQPSALSTQLEDARQMSRYSALALYPVETLRLSLGSAEPLSKLERFIARPFLDDQGRVIPETAWAAFDHPIPLTLCMISYDQGGALEQIDPPDVSPTLPSIWATRYASVYVWDHYEWRGWICATSEAESTRLFQHLTQSGHGRPEPSPSAESGLERPPQPSTPATPPKLIATGPLIPLCDWETYRSAILEIKKLIERGEVYQVNFTTPLTTSLSSAVSHREAYTQLRAHNPSPFGAFIRLDKATSLLCFSPERLARWSWGGIIETAPIKGTRPRKKTEALDRSQREDLLKSEKDRAEHLMIVDLERNDLGRICRTGTVRVRELCALKTYPSVHHLVTTIEGQLKPEVRLAELLSAIFPGGSITGAPKVRALQLIRRLEGRAREVYCGALGYFDPAGRADLNIPIRTAWLSNDRLTYAAGGGVVADSSPEEEWAELWVKTRALERGLGLS
jgi:anthranilate/para-aminobenzoate synthase component I